MDVSITIISLSSKAVGSSMVIISLSITVLDEIRKVISCREEVRLAEIPVSLASLEVYYFRPVLIG